MWEPSAGLVAWAHGGELAHQRLKSWGAIHMKKWRRDLISYLNNIQLREGYIPL
jgi:hypothetical protein